MSIAYTTIPFVDCDSDSQSVDTTGGTFAAIFTNLVAFAGNTCREIIVQNRGAANVLIGKTAATARYNILPGDMFSMSPKDLTKIAIKADTGSQTVDVFLII